MRHALVTPIAYFTEVSEGKRTADLKKDDRPYQVGDEIILQEFDEDKQLFTGRELSATATVVLRNAPREGLRKGFVMICFTAGEVKVNQLPIGYGETAEKDTEEENGPVINEPTI